MRDLSSRSRGRWGEDRAAAHYKSLGFEILVRNWRAPLRQPPGELDLIVGRDGLLVFCEVKARKQSGYGGAAIAVDEAKQSRIRALAEAWLVTNPSCESDVRFDVVAIEGVTLTHHEAAF